MNIKKLPLTLALLHFIVFLGALIYTLMAMDSEASMVWYFFYFVDFPLSLLYFFGDVIYVASGVPILEWVFYPPYIIHGVLATVWWFYIGKIMLKIFLKLM